jgi:hypothetical protein
MIADIQALLTITECNLQEQALRVPVTIVASNMLGLGGIGDILGLF